MTWLRRDPFVDARGIQVGKKNSLLIRASYPVNRVKGAGHAAGAAEGAQDLAGEIHLVDPAHAAHEHNLSGSVGEADRPWRGRHVPNRFQIALSVKGLDAAVTAVGDIDDVVMVHHKTVRGVEVARLAAAL